MDGQRRSRVRNEVLSVFLPLLAGLLLLGAVLALSRYNGLLLDWAGRGVVETTVVVAVAVAGTLLVLLLMLLGFACCRRLSDGR